MSLKKLHPTKIQLSAYLKKKAVALGFSACGIAPTFKLSKEDDLLKHWLSKGYHGSMKFLERNIEKRTNPTLLFKNTKSLIIVAYKYFNKTKLPTDNDNPKIAKYASFKPNYHKFIKDKLYELLAHLSEKVDVEGSAFVDSSPILEKAWAKRAGIGWQGKNTLLLNKNLGSYFFLGVLLVNIELAYDKPSSKNLCKTCTRCVDACPTNALVEGKFLDATKCISYHTIENRGKIPALLYGKFQNYIFGCDICQDVCPWNKTTKINSINKHQDVNLLNITKDDWNNLSEKRFIELYAGTELERTGYETVKRNLKL